MRKIVRNGALLLLVTNFVAACSYLPKFPEPGLGAAHGVSPVYDSSSALTAGGVLFDSETATLQPEAHRTVTRAVVFLLDNPDSKVIVEGHSDHVGDESYNQILSEMRAGTIVRALRSKGISADRITAIGFGESKPVADNNTPEGRRANRRVEIVFQ